MCSLVTQQGKCYLHSRSKSWGGLQLWREPLRVNRRGVLSEFLLFWMILFSLGGGGGVWSQPGQLNGSICVFQAHPGFPYECFWIPGDWCWGMLLQPVLKPEQSSVTDLYFYRSRFLSHHWIWPIPGDCEFICHVSTHTWNFVCRLCIGRSTNSKTKARSLIFESKEAQETFQNFNMVYQLSLIMFVWQI